MSSIFLLLVLGGVSLFLNRSIFGLLPDFGIYLQENYRTNCQEILHRHFYYLISVVVAIIIIATISTSLVIFAVRKERPVSVVRVLSACPPMWIGFGSKCFYFSEDTGNWTFSQSSCHSLEADLAQINTTDELNFLKRYKGPYDHWIGLRRKSSSDLWKWTNNTGGDFVFKVRGTGECAYLNEKGVGSSRIYSERRWICSKPNSHVHSCQNTPSS